MMIINIIFLYLAQYLLDNRYLAFIFFIINWVNIPLQNNIDQNYIKIIEYILENDEINSKDVIRRYFDSINYFTDLSLDERLKKYLKYDNYQLIKLFENSLVYTQKDSIHFYKNQKGKMDNLKINQKRQYRNDTIQYLIVVIMIILAIIPIIIFRFNNIYYFYYLYDKLQLIVFVFLLIDFLYLLYFRIELIKKIKIDTSYYDLQSLCFHKNCMEILSIEDDRLNFDEKGYIIDNEKIVIKPKIRINYSLFLLLINLLIFIWI
ncbi:MAG: hypothetical protein SO253_00545 [Bacilli bacterium]|nr:hypothetical protein [Bacilli bacterium]